MKRTGNAEPENGLKEGCFFYRINLGVLGRNKKLKSKGVYADKRSIGRKPV